MGIEFMRNILILITLISGLISTSLIKNKTRLLEKELIFLDNEINSLSSNLSEASLDFQYLTTPKHISSLAKNFLDGNFSYYKESQIKKSIRPEKDLSILKKLKNNHTLDELRSEELINKKLKVANKIDNTQLFIAKRFDNKQSFTAKRIDNKKPQQSKKIEISQKFQNWVGLQVVKTLLGIPAIPSR